MPDRNELRSGVQLVREAKRPRGNEPWWGIITECDRESGFAKVKKAEGTLPDLEIVSGAEEVVVWMGVNSFCRVDDPVRLGPNGGKVRPAWTIQEHIAGIIWTEPDEDELADEQDDGGGECDECCDESVAADD